MKHADPERVVFLKETLAGIPCRIRPQFGCVACFAGDRMFAGVNGEDVYLRIGGEEREALAMQYPAVRTFEPLPGRRMNDYVVLPPEALADPTALGRLLERAFTAALALPPKADRRRAR
jgi:TfoX/Sxy family transcriptional regulator of competence genes